MNDDVLLDELLLRWERVRESEVPPSAEQICAEYPHLLTPFKSCVEQLKRVDRYAEHTDPAREATHLSLGRNGNDSANLYETVVPGSEELESASMAHSPWAGKVIGNYRLVEVLGEGGMGTVWLAEQQQPMRRQVALKLIRPSIPGRQVLARFDAERQALAMMDHAHIARVFDGGTSDDGSPFFAMELVNGVPLTQYCDQCCLSITDRLRLFKDVCDAVQHAHQKGIIHRDIKPNNVLLTESDGKPMVKVIDFGLAKALQHTTNLTDKTMSTEFGQIVGTIRYMSPEQAQLNQADVDTRTDIYSLGVMLYEMLVGSTPLDDATLSKKSFFEILAVIREGEVQRPSARLRATKCPGSIAALRKTDVNRLHESLSGELDWIVLKSLEKEREDRYDTASSLAADVNRFLNHIPVVACPPTAAYRFKKFLIRHRLAVSVMALLTLTVNLGLIGTTYAWQRALSAEDVASKRANLLTELNDDLRQSLQRESEERRFAQAVADFVREDFLELTSVQGQLRDMNFNSAELDKDATLNQLLDRAAAKLSKRNDLDPKIEAELSAVVGVSYREIGESQKAIPFLQTSASILEKVAGAEHEATLTATSQLAMALGESARIEEALVLLEEILRVRERELGREHADTIQSRFNFAIALERSGQFEASTELLRTVAKQRERHLGKAHRDVAFTNSWLARQLAKVGKFDEAIPLAEDALEQLISIHGRRHPSTLIAANGLAAILQDAGQPEKALSRYQAILKIRKELLGEDHPHTLVSMNNVAFVLDELGYSNEAIAIHETVLESRIARTGKAHPDAVESMRNLGLAFNNASRHLEAERCYQDAYQLSLLVHGEDHPSTLDCLNNLASIRLELGRKTEAMPLLEQLAKQRLDSLGPNHQSTLTAQNNLAYGYIEIGEPAKAADLFRIVYEIRIELLGADHPETITSANNLGAALYRSGKLVEAMDLLESAVMRMERVYGPDHPSTLATSGNLGVLCLAHGVPQEGMTRLAQTLERRLAKLGREHVDTQLSITTYVEGLILTRQFGLAKTTLLESLRTDQSQEEIASSHSSLWMHLLAFTERKLGNNPQAIECGKKAIAMLEAAPDVKITDLQHAKINLAAALISINRRSDAEEQLQLFLANPDRMKDNWAFHFAKSMLTSDMDSDAEQKGNELSLAFENLRRLQDQIPITFRATILNEASQICLLHYEKRNVPNQVERWRQECDQLEREFAKFDLTITVPRE